MSGRGLEAHPELRKAHPEVLEELGAHPKFQEGSGGWPGYSGVVGRPARRSGWGREACPAVPDWSGGPPGGPGGVGSPSSRSGMGREANPEVRKAHPEIRQGRVAHPEVRKVHPEVREGSGGPPGGPEGLPGGPGGVGRPTQRSGRGLESLLGGREVSGGPCCGPGEVGKPTQRSGMLIRMSGRIGRTIRRFERSTHRSGRVRRPPAGLGWVGRPTRRSVKPNWRSKRVRWAIWRSSRSTRRSGRGRDAHPLVRKWLGGPIGGPGGVERPTLRFWGVGSPMWRSRRG